MLSAMKRATLSATTIRSRAQSCERRECASEASRFFIINNDNTYCDLIRELEREAGLAHKMRVGKNI